MEKGLSLADLKVVISETDAMISVVGHMKHDELELFMSEEDYQDYHDEHDHSLPSKRFVKLQAWAQGRERVWAMHKNLQHLREVLEQKMAALIDAESQLQEYAALKDKERSLGYIDIFSAVMKFVDKLKVEWLSIVGKPARAEIRELMSLFSLRILFHPSLYDTFQLWRQKSDSKRTEVWGEDAKSKVLAEFFSILDPDGSGEVEMEELRLILNAFSIEVPDDCSLQEFMQSFDDDHDEKLGMREFRAFAETQINVSFDLFARGEEHITVDDLRRVAIEMTFDVSEDDLDDMMRLVGSEKSTPLEQIKLSRDHFQEIFLMKAVWRGVQVAGKAHYTRRVSRSPHVKRRTFGSAAAGLCLDLPPEETTTNSSTA